MKRIIDISEEDYAMFKHFTEIGMGNAAMTKIINSKPLNECTNGEVLEALFPFKIDACYFDYAGKEITIDTSDTTCFHTWFPNDWWNAPYKDQNNEII